MYLLPFCYLFSGVLYPFFKTSFVPFQEECSLYHFILAFLLVYFVVTQSLKLLQRFRRSPSLSPSNVGGFMFSWAMKWSYNILATFISFIHFSVSSKFPTVNLYHLVKHFYSGFNLQSRKNIKIGKQFLVFL